MSKEVFTPHGAKLSAEPTTYSDVRGTIRGVMLRIGMADEEKDPRKAEVFLDIENVREVYTMLKEAIAEG